MRTERERDGIEHPRHLVDTITSSALSLVGADGTVVIHAEDGEFVATPDPSIDPGTLATFSMRKHLYYVANAIRNAIVLSVEDSRRIHVEHLACRLAPYREHPEFVRRGAGLILVNEQGLPVRIAATIRAAAAGH